jgi:hypothetical protein
MGEGRRGSEVDEWGRDADYGGMGRGTWTVEEWGGGGGCVERGHKGVEILQEGL